MRWRAAPLDHVHDLEGRRPRRGGTHKDVSHPSAHVNPSALDLRLGFGVWLGFGRLHMQLVDDREGLLDIGGHQAARCNACMAAR
mmetsp:Transcript_62829/g.186927  ORF Transcript_62829/g.186927 Transcript_62829/m.186927 type:complete len:85 (-) Transcript_62829:570-824(-)